MLSSGTLPVHSWLESIHHTAVLMSSQKRQFAAISSWAPSRNIGARVILPCWLKKHKKSLKSARPEVAAAEWNKCSSQRKTTSSSFPTPYPQKFLTQTSSNISIASQGFGIKIIQLKGMEMMAAKEEIKVLHQLGNDTGPNSAATFSHEGYEKTTPNGVSTAKTRLQSHKNSNIFCVLAESEWFGSAGTLKGHLVQPLWPEMFLVMGHPGWGKVVLLTLP